MIFQSPIVLQTWVSVHRPISEWVSQGKLQESFQKGLGLSSEELHRCFASFETEPYERHRIALMDLALKCLINLFGPLKSLRYCLQLSYIPSVSIENIRTAAFMKKSSYF